MKTKNKTWMLNIILLLIIPLSFADTTMPIITSSSPSTIQNNQNINLTIITNENSYCRYGETDATYESLDYTFPTSNTTNHLAQLTLIEGSHLYYVRCQDEYNNTMLSSELIAFTIDTTAPSITSKKPAGMISSDHATLNITTNEDSACRYDTTISDYNQMTGIFDKNEGQIHEEEILHLTEGEKTYYISCQDNAKNTVTNTLTFTVSLPLSATIHISESPPLKADTYKVTVQTTKNLISAPTLYYKFDDDNTQRTISLTGADNRWEGYLIIAESDLDRAAKFYFQGTDLNGGIGNKITSGEIFLVDTTKPQKVTSITSYQEGKYVKLAWFYDGEEAEEFFIYKSTKTAVNYVDYYTKTASQKFTDQNVIAGEEYFYRIAAVDKAGNIGELSEQTQTFLTQTEETKTNTTTAATRLNPKLTYELNNTIKRLTNDVLDMTASIGSLEKTTDNAKNQVISSMNLLENAKNAKTSAELAIKELNPLFEQDLNDAELKNSIDQAIAKVENAKKESAKTITIKDSLDYKQTLTQEDIDTAISELTLREDLTEKELEEYKRNASKIIDTAEVYSRIIKAEIQYLSSDTKKLGIVAKNIKLKEQTSDINIVEIIPKTVAEKADELIYSKNPKILNDDPVLSFEYPIFTEDKISYMTYEDKLISDLKNTKTIVLLNPKNFIQKEQTPASNDEPTANVVKNFSAEKIIDTVKGSLAIILGVLIISGLAAYYFILLKDNDDEKIFHRQESQIIAENTQNSSNIIANNELNRNSGLTDKSMLPEFIENTTAFETNDTVEYRHLTNVIDHATNHVNNLDFENAKKEYELIYTLFKNTTFQTNAAKSRVLHQISSLYNKIMISSKITLARDQAMKQDMDGLKKSMDELKTIVEIIKKEEKKIVPLINHASDYVLYYEEVLNNLRRKYGK